MYTVTNYKTKKRLKEDVNEGKSVEVFQPGPFKTQFFPDVEYSVWLEGPHYPEPHRWYASCKVINGFIVKGSVK